MYNCICSSQDDRVMEVEGVEQLQLQSKNNKLKNQWS